MSMTIYEPLLTVKDLAEKFNVSDQTIRREIKEKRLEFVRVRDCIRFTPEAIEEYIREHSYREIAGKGAKPRGIFRKGLTRLYRNIA